MKATTSSKRLSRTYLTRLAIATCQKYSQTRSQKPPASYQTAWIQICSKMLHFSWRQQMQKAHNKSSNSFKMLPSSCVSSEKRKSWPRSLSWCNNYSNKTTLSKINKTMMTVKKKPSKMKTTTRNLRKTKSITLIMKKGKRLMRMRLRYKKWRQSSIKF